MPVRANCAMKRLPTRHPLSVAVFLYTSTSPGPSAARLPEVIVTSVTESRTAGSMPLRLVALPWRPNTPARNSSTAENFPLLRRAAPTSWLNGWNPPLPVTR